MNTNSTNINDLPLTGGQNNVSLQINPVQQQPQQQASMNQNTISELVSGLQQASSAGATQLQSRDISQNTVSLTNDEQTRPNYIPDDNIPRETEAMRNKYVEEDSDALENYQMKLLETERLNRFYNDLQTPLFLAILYFIFQLPITKEYLFLYLPALFLTQQQQTSSLQRINLNIYGNVVLCVAFAALYYLFSKFVQVSS